MPRLTYRPLADINSIPVPASTATFTPVSQADLWGSVCRAFETYGYRLNAEEHMVHRKRPLFVSRMEVTADFLPNDQRVKWTVGVMNSYDKSMSARIIFGSKVLICSNGLIIADRILRTKHTTHVWDRLPNLVSTAVDSFGDEVQAHIKEQERLKERLTDLPSLAEFSMNLARYNILPKAKVLDFYEECVEPSFDYQTERLCLWNLQAAYTHIAKEMNPIERPRRIIGFDKALQRYYALN